MDDAATRMNDAPESFDDYETRLIVQVAEHGWRTTSVAGAEGVPAFHYTTGFWRAFDRPEVILFDMTPTLAHDVFGLMAHEMGQGRAFGSGTPVPELIDGESVWFMAVDPAKAAAYLRSTAWFYRGAAFPCWQLVWGDAAGRLPWDTGFEAGLIGVQPDLSTGNDWAGLGASGERLG